MKRKRVDLKARRLELGMTIEAVAVKAGISPSMVRFIERGLELGSLRTRMRLADALKIPRRELLTEDEVNALARPARGTRGAGR